jgi:hypothetical protein
MINKRENIGVGIARVKQGQESVLKTAKSAVEVHWF